MPTMWQAVSSSLACLKLFMVKSWLNIKSQKEGGGSEEVWEWNTDIGPPSGIENIFFPPTQQLKVYSILISPDPRKEKKNHKSKNPTNTWLTRTKQGFGGWAVKVVEMEKPSWKPSPTPTPKPHFFFSARGKRGGGQRCSVLSFNSRLLNGRKSSARGTVRQSRSRLSDSANAK